MLIKIVSPCASPHTEMERTLSLACMSFSLCNALCESRAFALELVRDVPSYVLQTYLIPPDLRVHVYIQCERPF